MGIFEHVRSSGFVFRFVLPHLLPYRLVDVTFQSRGKSRKTQCRPEESDKLRRVERVVVQTAFSHWKGRALARRKYSLRHTIIACTLLCALLALLNLDPVLTYWVMFITIVPAVIGMVLVGVNYVRDLFSANRGR